VLQVEPHPYKVSNRTLPHIMLSLKNNTLDVKKISEIRRTIKKKNSVFADMKYLDNLILPSEIIGRFKESEELLRFLMGLDEGLPVPFVSVYGRSGSGKSTITKFVCQEISDIVEMCFVNLRKTRTVFGCANQINYTLGGKFAKKSQGLGSIIQSIQNLICDLLEKNSKRNFVLVLDEFDVIFSDRRGDPSDFLFKLLRIAEEMREKGFLFCVIGISNNSIGDYDLNDRVKSRIGNSYVFFRPYSKDELFEILYDRASKAFLIDVSSDVLLYCSEACSLDHGDVRRALDVLRLAGQNCNGNITRKDIDDSLETIQHDKVGQTLKSSSSNFKRIFGSLARISYLSGKKWHSTSEVYNQYEKFFTGKKHKKLSYRRVFDILGEIEQSGLIMSKNLSAGRHGYSKQYMLSVPADTIRILSESTWENWEKIKNANFEMKHNPKNNGYSYMARLAKYQDVVTWKKILGSE